MHHYPGLDYRKIKRMTLRQIKSAVNDVPFVNPMCGGSEADEKDGDAKNDDFDKYGGLELPSMR